MMGAVAGDIVGSNYEFHPVKTLVFPFFAPGTRFTDDSVLTIATAFTLMTDGDYAENYRIFGRLYPLAGYGRSFREWLHSDLARPYGSWGNGSAMRVSPVGWALDSEEEVLREARRSAEVTHNDPEGIKGAQATALTVFLARSGADVEQIRREISGRFGYDLSRTAAEIRPGYQFDVSCAGSVPEALVCALEGENWEHAVRLAISLGGDADTQACIAGAVAEALHGPIPEEIAERVIGILPEHLAEILDDFCNQD